MYLFQSYIALKDGQVHINIDDKQKVIDLKLDPNYIPNGISIIEGDKLLLNPKMYCSLNLWYNLIVWLKEIINDHYSIQKFGIEPILMELKELNKNSLEINLLCEHDEVEILESFVVNKETFLISLIKTGIEYYTVLMSYSQIFHILKDEVMELKILESNFSENIGFNS